ncbi:hypothetical protein [Halobacillus andaensis]|uniref:hypothetical protein n=1 Tax=Halobacillus andaensis TaxID=1176239 RepID=UPI001E6273CD|nr:hypothetical protein [Halobacillus andaensis]MBP2003918.1 hypothetical protein [Halobacillus andaensis]
MKNSLALGAGIFFCTLLVMKALEVPSPFLASLIAAFLVFEISCYHFVGKMRRNRKLN